MRSIDPIKPITLIQSGRSIMLLKSLCFVLYSEFRFDFTSRIVTRKIVDIYLQKVILMEKN